MSPSELLFATGTNPCQKALTSTAKLHLGKGALRGGRRNCNLLLCLFKNAYNMCEHTISAHTRDLHDTACQAIAERLVGARTPHATAKFYLHCKRHSRSRQMSLAWWHHLSKRASEAADNRKASLGRRAPATLVAPAPVGLLGAEAEQEH